MLGAKGNGLPIEIIIPAHNEAAVIERCLRSLFQTAVPGELRACVVANACSDATAERARQFGRTREADAVRVIETDIPSKTNSLNLGDQAASDFPRFYVDADVAISTDGVRQLAGALGEPGILAVSPLIELDYTNRPWPVRAYYQIWTRLPYCRSGISGAGVYAVNAAGHQRIGRFPNITADDAFVRLQFAPGERKTVETCRSMVVPPKTIATIIDIKTRSHFGNQELRQLSPRLWDNERVQHGGALVKLALNPFNWPALAVYGYVKLATRARVRQRIKRGENHQWERDHSSRECIEEMAES